MPLPQTEAQNANLRVILARQPGAANSAGTANSAGGAEWAAHDAGYGSLLGDINSWISSQDIETQISWEYSSKFNMNSTLVRNLQTAFNLSNNQVEQMFIDAANLKL
jgi:hypothetical protein